MPTERSTLMNDVKYIGLDVHQATISATVLDSAGKLVMGAILETKVATILQFIHGLRGSLHVTFEEGTCAAWLYDLLKPHVTQILVCDPRKNALLKVGNKSDGLPPDGRAFIEIRGANHFLFSDDGALLKSHIVLRTLRMLGIVGIDGRRQLAVTAYCLRSCFDACLKGESVSRFKSSSPLYPEIQVLE